MERAIKQKRFYKFQFIMPYYRQVVMTSKRASASDLSLFFKSHAKTVISCGGIFHGIEDRGVKELGYPIEDRRSGVLVRHRETRLFLTKYSIPTDALLEISQECKLNESVVRFEVFKTRDPFKDYLTTKNHITELQKEHGKDINTMPAFKIPLTKKEVIRNTGKAPMSVEEKLDHKMKEMMQNGLCKQEEEEEEGEEEEFQVTNKIPDWQRDFTWDDKEKLKE